MDEIILNNKLSMPQLGYGVWKVPNEEAAQAVEKAIASGYRLIDTAMIYGNEVGVGQGIKASGINRDELFITTKVWNKDQGYDNTLKAFETSLEKLEIDQTDLYLIHWPTPKYDQYVETYQALEELYKAGKTKAIGVCNFDIEHLERIIDECDIVPSINQVECHPYLQQKELKAFCKKHGIQIEAYSPLMNGTDVLNDETIQKLAKKKNKTAAQIILRWHMQEGVVAIPKTVTPSRMTENLDVFDFELTADEMAEIAALDRGERNNQVPSEMNVR